MLELLIAILIALGCSIRPDASYEEISRLPEYETAKLIYDSGSYEKTEDGGVVIVETGGD